MKPIEHMWDVLGLHIRAHDPLVTSLDDLFHLLPQESQVVSQDTLHHLVH